MGEAIHGAGRVSIYSSVNAKPSDRSCRDQKAKTQTEENGDEVVRLDERYAEDNRIKRAFVEWTRSKAYSPPVTGPSQDLL